VRLALRHLAKSPGFTAAALVTLALGIGVNTTAFTALNQLLLQAVPYRDADRMVQIWAAEPRNEHMGVAPGDYFDLRASNSVFESVAVYVPYASDSLTEPGQPAVNLGANHVSADFFKVFGIEPELGRTFSADEAAHMDDVTLVANYYWREHYASDKGILGRTVRLNGKIFTIIGVLPVSMDNPTLFGRRIAFWSLDPTQLNFNVHNLTWYTAAARLKPGVTMEQAKANLKAIGNRLAHEFPNTNAHREFRASHYPTSNQMGAGSLAGFVMALSLLVLVIACVNLANLQLVRTTRRAQEFAVRLALGCSRARIVGMLLEESLLLSLAGGLLALLVAKWGNLFVGRYLSIDMPLDSKVLAFTFGASLLTGAAFGTIPALAASRQNLNSALKAGGRGATAGWGRRAFREVLVVVEIVLALTVLSAAAFFVQGIYRLSHQQLGWDGSHALFGQIILDHDHYGEHGDPRSVAFTDRLKESIGAIPGVTRVVPGAAVPTFGFGQVSYRVEGRPAPEPGHETQVETGNVDPGYFATYSVPIIMGRDFDATDRLGSRHVVIITAAMAKKCWPGEDPIGKRLGLVDLRIDPSNVDWSEVVGVVRDFHHLFDFLGGNDGSAVYRPWAQNSHRWVFFHVSTSGEPETYRESIRRAVASVAPDFALNELAPVKSMVEDSLSYFTFLRRALVELSLLGLTLSAVGIYGVIATLVAERTAEIGVRMALGAQSPGLVWLFLRSGLLLSVLGAAVGGAASYLLVHTLTRMLPIIPPMDPLAITPIAAFIVLVAGVSCLIPALRSTRVDPSVALRTE
jgi:putative ABC transport system permease protein